MTSPDWTGQSMANYRSFYIAYAWVALTEPSPRDEGGPLQSWIVALVVSARLLFACHRTDIIHRDSAATGFERPERMVLIL